MKPRHKLQRPNVKGYPTTFAVIGRIDNKVNDNYTTKSMARQKKKHFGIFKKSEE